MLKVTIIRTILASLLIPAVSYASNSPSFVSPHEVSGEATEQRYIVTYVPGATNDIPTLSLDGITETAFSLQKAMDILGDKNINVIGHLDFLHSSIVEMTPEQARVLVDDPNIAMVEVDPIRYLLDLEIEPYAQQVPYGIRMVQADQLSDAYAANRKICVIDSGYLRGHTDLPSAGVTGSTFPNHGPWYTDGNGHGTHVSGTITALNNNVGVIGVLPSGVVGLHNVKIFNDAGRWTYASNLIQAIQSCQNAGSHVVNMSLGGGQSSLTEQNAMRSFYQQGMLLVAAAGNSGNGQFSYPASYDAVMSVAAVNNGGNVANFSQYNSQVEIAAPGVNVLSTGNNGGYLSYSGTSMASPHVAGVAALVWSYFPQCRPERVRQSLNQTALDRGATGRDPYYGWGIIQAKSAYQWLANYGC
ncbi:S8 family peptidase [Vibrio cholerae]